MQQLYIWIMVVVTQQYVITKIHQIVHIKWVDFIVCKLHPQKS